MPEENVFGLPVNVDSRANILAHLAESDEPAVYAVARVSDLSIHAIPEPFRSRNRTTRCDECGELCWYDPNYLVPGVKIMCYPHCVPLEYVIHAEVDQVAEVRKAFPEA